MTPSPMLHAIDLLRVHADALQPDDLQLHAKEVMNTMMELNNFLNSSVHKSANALLNARRMAKKLHLHMAHVQSLLNAYQAAFALVAAAQAAGTANPAPSGKPAWL